MAERILDIKDYCTEYCNAHAKDGAVHNIVPILLHMDDGAIIFGFYCRTYNQHRAGSVVLRKASIHASELDVLRMMEERHCATGMLESNRVAAEHVACWSALEKAPLGIRDLVARLEKEAMYFKREIAGTRKLKPRIEQDIRNYNLVHYDNRALVPMIFDLGRSGSIFGFYRDTGEAADNRSTGDTLTIEYATAFRERDELWAAIDRGYSSRRRACLALEHIQCYYSLMDMQELADNMKAKELIARLPAKPKPPEPREEPAAPREDQTEEGYLKLWGWEIRVVKNVLPKALTQDVNVSQIANGVSRVLKTDVGKPAKKLLKTELRLPFTGPKAEAAKESS